MIGKEKTSVTKFSPSDDWHKLLQTSGLFQMVSAKATDRRRSEGEKFGRVTVNQARIFGYIFSRPGVDIRISRLAHDLDVTPAAASQAVERLVADGLLDRRHDTNDRRAVVITISEKGRKVLDEIRSESSALLSDLYHETGLPKEDIAAFSRVLGAIHEALLARWRCCIGSAS